jgi:hypothetical protein
MPSAVKIFANTVTYARGFGDGARMEADFILVRDPWVWLKYFDGNRNYDANGQWQTDFTRRLRRRKN